MPDERVRYDYEEIIPRVRAELERGEKPKSIMSSLGISRFVFDKARRHLPPEYQFRLKDPKAAVRQDFATNGVSMGFIGRVVHHADRDFRRWLIAEAKKHQVTVAEVMAACAWDQYLDEKENAR